MSGTPLIFICTCYETLSRTIPRGVLRTGIVARRPNAHIEFVPSLCRREDIDLIAGLIKERKHASVLLAACSPFARGNVVLDGLARRNPAMQASLVDVREGCAWVHGGNPDAAAAKAVDLVCMGLAGLRCREHSSEFHFQPVRRVLVVGAGPAGLAAAGTLARLGIEVSLAERMSRPGGLLNQIGRLFPYNMPGREFLATFLSEASHPCVDLLPKTSVTRIEGDPGRFEAHLSLEGRDMTVTAGAVILACGAMPVLPQNRFHSGELSGVISQLELETRLNKLEREESAPAGIAGAVFIQCVDAREDARPYCSTICCPTALKNALRLKNLNRDISVTVLHRGIMTPGRDLEELYRQTMASGVRFVAFSPASPPEVHGDGFVSSVSLTDALSARRLEIAADLVVLSTPLKPRPETASLAGDLGLRLDEIGFACGTEPMQPLVAPTPGVYLCGAVRWPVSAQEAVDQGRAAAIKAAGFLAQGALDLNRLFLPGSRRGPASIRTEACSRCGRCVSGCPYGACRREKNGPVTVCGIRCRGCGLCVAVCPSGAVRIPEQDSASVRAMLREIAPRPTALREVHR